jgi:tRNA(adenine34) deaminase
MMTPEDYIRLSMQEAEKAVQEGNNPFGVVVVDAKGTIVWKDHDRSKALMDPTAHGEVNAVRGLCKKLNTMKLAGYKFYTNAQPCTVCMATMIRVEVAEVYYGSETDPNASLPISVEELSERATQHKVKVYGSILAEETLAHRERLLNQEE